MNIFNTDKASKPVPQPVPLPAPQNANEVLTRVRSEKIEKPIPIDLTTTDGIWIN